MEAVVKFPATTAAVALIRAERSKAAKEGRPAPKTVTLNSFTWTAICAEFKQAGNYFQSKNPDVGQNQNTLYGLGVETDASVPLDGARFPTPPVQRPRRNWDNEENLRRAICGAIVELANEPAAPLPPDIGKRLLASAKKVAAGQVLTADSRQPRDEPPYRYDEPEYIY